MATRFLLGASRTRRRRVVAALVVLAVLVGLGIALSRTHHDPPLALGRAAAVRVVLHDRLSGQALRRTRWTRAELFAIDSSVEQVNFYRGAQLVFEAAVRSNGTLQESSDAAVRAVPYGNPFAYGLGMILGLTLVFLLMVGVLPIRRMRNLDAIAMVGFVAPLILIQHRYVDASAIVAVIPMLYLGIRCGWVALRPNRDDAPSVPIFEALTARRSERERVRLLRTLTIAAAITFVMVGVSSTGPVDVIYAVMEGATKLVHGVLPYGHLPGDVIHGDTYPVLSYALFVPVALVAPVSSLWDSVDVALAAGVVAALAAAACVFVANAGRLRSRGRRDDGVERAGLRAAIGVLCFPPLLVIVSSGTTDVVVGALLALALVLWRSPGASTTVLAVGGLFKLAPFVLIPIWLAPLRGRKLLTALLGAIAVSAGSVGLILALGGIGGLNAMLHAVSYQFSRGSFQSVWHATGTDALQPIAQELVLVGVVVLVFGFWRKPELASDQRRLAAASACALVGVQLAANYWAYLYLAWIAAPVMMSLLAQPEAETELARARTHYVRRAGIAGVGVRGTA